MSKTKVLVSILACGLCCGIALIAADTPYKAAPGEPASSFLQLTPQEKLAIVHGSDADGLTSAVAPPPPPKELDADAYDAYKRAYYAQNPPEGGGGIAQGAPNDECATAITIGNGTTPFNNSSATTSAEASPCGLFGCDLWYRYVATCNGTATATTCLGGAAGLDTVVAVYSACGGSVLGCNDDGPPTCAGANCGFSGSTVTWAATSGTAYLIRVAGYNCCLGAGNLTLSCTAGGGGPANDLCGNATPISGPVGTTPTTNVGATNSPVDLPAGACFATSIDVWYSWTAPCSASVTFSFCPAQGGSATWDTVLAAYQGCAGTQLACNDDSCGLQSSITFAAVNGTNYRIRVTSFSANASGTGTLGWSMLCQACPPLPCPPGGIEENEPCGTDANGGCNMPTPTFTPIQCGQTLCGTAWANAGTRDTDWYEFCHNVGDIVITGNSQVPLVLFLLNTDCNNIQLLATGQVGECGTGGVTLPGAAAGTYHLFAGTGTPSGGIFDGYPCGRVGGNSYNLTLNCTDCPQITINELQINQVTWESHDTGLVSSSEYGHVLVRYVPPPQLLQRFLSIVLDRGQGPTVAVANMPLLGADIVGTGEFIETELISLNLVGVQRGQPIAGQAYAYGLFFSADPVDTVPSIPLNQTGVFGTIVYNYGGTTAPDDTNVAQLPPAAARPAKPAFVPGPKNWAWRNGVPNRDVGLDQCTPASMTMSAHWLNQVYNGQGINLGNQTWYQTLEKFKLDLRTTCPGGTPLTQIVPGKLRFYQRPNKGLLPGWRITYQGDRSVSGLTVFPPTYTIGALTAQRIGDNPPGTAVKPQFAYVLNELLDGEDVEIHVGWLRPNGTRNGGHSLCVIGALQHGNKMYIWTADDANQEIRCEDKPGDNRPPTRGGLRNAHLSQVLINPNGSMHLDGLAPNEVELVTSESPPLPTNDECLTAIAICVGTTHFDTTLATNSPELSPCGAFGADLWYSYTPSSSGAATATTCLNGAAGMDTCLAVYDGCGGNLMGCDDDGGGCPGAACGFSGSTVNWNAVGGTTYIIRVSGFGTCRGAADLTITGPICDQTGACCLGTSCVALTAAACSAQNGDFGGPGSSCGSIPCGISGTEHACGTGDSNGDGATNNFDIDAFVMLLTNPAAYNAAHPTVPWTNSDMNCDGAVNNFDIDPFVAVLTNHGTRRCVPFLVQDGAATCPNAPLPPKCTHQCQNNPDCLIPGFWRLTWIGPNGAQCSATIRHAVLLQSICDP